MTTMLRMVGNGRRGLTDHDNNLALITKQWRVNPHQGVVVSGYAVLWVGGIKFAKTVRARSDKVLT